MTRYADYKSKTIRLVLIPKPGEEEKIRAFKQLASRNGLKISRILFEKVEEFLKEHNWPPGNSQTVMTVFSEDAISDESQPQVYKAQLRTRKKNTIEVSEKELQQVHEQWEHITDTGKQSWLRILKQIDHPIAYEILEKERYDR